MWRWLALVLVLPVGCVAPWQRSVVELDYVRNAPRLGSRAVGAGIAVTAVADGAQVRAQQWCRSRELGSGRVTRGERYTYADNTGTGAAWVAALAAGGLFLMVGAVFAVVDDSEPSESDLITTSSVFATAAALLLPGLVAIPFLPRSAKVELKIDAGGATDAQWAGPAGPCSATVASAEPYAALLASVDVTPIGAAQSMVVQRAIRADATGRVAAKQWQFAQGLADWCRGATLTVAGGEAAPELDPADDTTATWDATPLRRVLAPQTPALALAAIAAVDAQAALVALSCCQSAALPALLSLCRQKCSQGDAAQGLHCERSCRSAGLQEACP